MFFFSLLKLLRPQQWSKNFFIFAGLIFAHKWGNLTLMSQAIIAFLAFSLAASSIYIFNDWLDRVADRMHPLKKYRPFAADTVNTISAFLLAGILALLGLGLGFILTPGVGWIVLIYIGLNIFYSAGLKYWIILDVFIIAAGFLLRVLAGTLGIGISASEWLLLCTLFLTLFLGFCKRTAEQRITDAQNRPETYSADLLSKLLSITATGSVVSYILYTLHQNTKFIYTVPLVLYGIFRYLYLLDKNSLPYVGIDIARDIKRDKQLLIVTVLWIVSIIFLGI